MSFYQKLYFPNQTPLCICLMCLYCIGNISNCSIKSCGRSGLAHEGTICLVKGNCLSSNSCHFVKNYFFQTKLLHAYVQYVYIVAAKYQIAPSKAVVGVDLPIKALSCIYKSHISEKLSKFSQLSFCRKIFIPNQTPSCICSMCLY